MEIKHIQLPKFDYDSKMGIYPTLHDGSRCDYSIHKLTDEEIALSEQPYKLELDIKRYMVTTGDNRVYIKCNGNNPNEMAEFIRRTIFVRNNMNKGIPYIATFDTEQECLDWILKREISECNAKADAYRRRAMKVVELGLGEVPEEFTKPYSEKELEAMNFKIPKKN